MFEDSLRGRRLSKGARGGGERERREECTREARAASALLAFPTPRALNHKRLLAG